MQWVGDVDSGFTSGNLVLLDTSKPGKLGPVRELTGSLAPGRSLFPKVLSGTLSPKDRGVSARHKSGLI